MIGLAYNPRLCLFSGLVFAWVNVLDIPIFFVAQQEIPSGRPRYLRSSGKKPLTAEEADRYEALARKRRSSKIRFSDSEPIVISDDEGEDKAEPTSAWERSPQPEYSSGFPDPASIGGSGGKSPVDLDGPLPNVRPLAMIDSDQGSADPDPNTVTGVLQRLENALKQVISILDAKWGSYADFHPFLVNCLGEVHRVGGAPLALRCERKLIYWQRLALRTEKLASSDGGLSKEADAQVRGNRAEELTTLKSALESFTVLDCA